VSGASLRLSAIFLALSVSAAAGFGLHGVSPGLPLFAALGAGWGAKKLGGGCFTTVLIFLLLYWLLRSI